MSDEQVASIVQRVQRLQEEKRTIEDDIKEVYAEARSNGYDVKVLRAVVKHLGKDQAEVEEFDALFDLYLQAVKKGLAGAGRATRTHVRETTAPVTPAAHFSPERDPQSGQHGSDSASGRGGESRTCIAGSEQESVADTQARNEPGSDEAASGGEGRKPLPETQAISGLKQACAIAAAAAGVTHNTAPRRDGGMPDLPAFLDRRAKPDHLSSGQ